MRGVFDEQQLEPVQPRQDTEFTLGSGTLLLIFFGLVLLCGLCFGLGYSFGRRSPSPTATVIQPQAATSSSTSKPSASEQSISTPSGSAADQGQASGSPANLAVTAPPAGTTASAELPPAPATAQAQPQVHPALASAPITPATQPAAQAVQPALTPSVPLMVQIAAVADAEDADVLVSALRKHGYAVTARREPADNLIHVRIGPFSTRGDALHWRQKLLDDGYNAIIQP